MVGKGTFTMRETRILEFKETITNTFLKTVSAFSNYNGGTILFGVDVIPPKEGKRKKRSRHTTLFRERFNK